MKKLKEKLNAKLSKNGGFTLIEMLIVVAIIAILIAVSIPVVNNALDRTKHATDAANERAAKAEIMVQYLSAGNAVVGGGSTDTTISTSKAYAYDAQNGVLLEKAPDVTYSKCSKHTANSFILLSITDDGEVYMKWATAYAADKITANDELCSMKEKPDHT